MKTRIHFPSRSKGLKSNDHIIKCFLAPFGNKLQGCLKLKKQCVASGSVQFVKLLYNLEPSEPYFLLFLLPHQTFATGGSPALILLIVGDDCMFYFCSSFSISFLNSIGLLSIIPGNACYCTFFKRNPRRWKSPYQMRSLTVRGERPSLLALFGWNDNGFI